jgi:subtilisin family serine protease
VRCSRSSLQSWFVACVAAVTLFALPAPAAAWVDANVNRIDDRIERVHVEGWHAAFEDSDPEGRMRIGVANPADVIYAVYVRYGHAPTAIDQAALAATGVSMAWPFRYIPYIESRATFAQVAVISALPGVTRVEAVPVMYAINHYGSRVVRSRDSRGLSASENYALFPSVQQELGLDGTGVVIAILDTGVNDDLDSISPLYPGHESLRGKFLGGGEFWCGQELCSTALEASMNPTDHGAEASSYHATHCAGTALGTGGPGGFFAGVAPGARLVDCKVLSDAGASVGGSARGLDWVIGNRTRLWAGLAPSSIWQGIDVVSMSLGSTECAGGSGTSDGSGADNELVNAAVDAGLVVVIATGNDDGIDCIASPAAADKSIAVGALAHRRTLARGDDGVTDFSNEGVRDDDGDADHLDEMKPSVVAPGAGIISANGDFTSDGTSYHQLSGTSMATPHVAGCAALLLQANPSLTPLQVRSILQNTAEHDIPSDKPSGDRGQNPFGLDVNYDPSCGWGLVDMYAACKEAMNGTSGVQVVLIGATARPQDGQIDVRWVTQREYPFLGFRVYRAPDVDGAPGPYTLINPLPILPGGDPVIANDDNRTPYVYVDGDPALELGQQYWYRVAWVDQASVEHAEPAVPVAFGALARIATAHYQIVHNAVDNDLLVRVGGDHDYQVGALGGADFEVLGPGESAQDSAVVLLGTGTPADTGPATIGSLEHYWSVGFRQGDGLEPFLPPSQGGAMFLQVTDGGYVNRTGRVTAFSLFVNDAPGSSGGTTYVTNHAPLPQPLIEGGVVPVTLWIPEPQAAAVAVASFRAEAAPGAVRLELVLIEDDPGATARVFRGVSDAFAAATALGDAQLVTGQRFVHVDAAVETDVTYYYWIELRGASGGSYLNGPIEATLHGTPRATFAAPARPNPVKGSTVFEYVIGSDVAGAGDAEVSIAVLDLQGRTVRSLADGRQPAGAYRVAWRADDARGARVEPGMYWLRFQAGPVTQVVKVAVVN